MNSNDLATYRDCATFSAKFFKGRSEVMFEKIVDACYFRLAMMVPVKWFFWPWRNRNGHLVMTPLGRFGASAYGYFEAKTSGVLIGLPWSYRMAFDDPQTSSAVIERPPNA